MRVSTTVAARYLSGLPRIRWGHLGHMRLSLLVGRSSCRSAMFRRRQRRLRTTLVKTSALRTGSSFLRA